MDKVRIQTEQGEVIIPYTDKVAHGIFVIDDDDNIALRNAKTLKINIEQSVPNELVRQVTKFSKTGILTLRAGNKCLQYIFKEYASREDVENFVSEYDVDLANLMRQAYNLSKMDKPSDLDLLSTLGNVN
ncbi:MAG TPA: hypothetical protein VK177_04430 [Flavobacteriales bacterium]|nr:hypothetical protein [Flavobacteriales bacterium]